METILHISSQSISEPNSRKRPKSATKRKPKSWRNNGGWKTRRFDRSKKWRKGLSKRNKRKNLPEVEKTSTCPRKIKKPTLRAALLPVRKLRSGCRNRRLQLGRTETSK